MAITPLAENAEAAGLGILRLVSISRGPQVSTSAGLRTSSRRSPRRIELVNS
jgi:hypothetical protein